MTVITERYILGRVLGSGGFGVTYIAKDLLFDKICAIKEYLPFNWVYRKGTDIIPSSDSKRIMFEHGKKRFLDEARTLCKFSGHENIVQVENFFASNNTAYLVMEYLDGINFRTFISKKGGKVSFEVAQEVFLATAKALNDVHSQNVLHRDISAENIFITRKGKIKLIDFGSARQIAANSDQSLSVMLKPGPAPLEQYSSNGCQGPWTDIYSLGSTFYNAVTGTQVPAAPDRNENDTLVPLQQLCPSIPEEWCKAIDKSLKVSYKDRYQSISELLEDIKPPKKAITKQPMKPYIAVLKSQIDGQCETKINLNEYQKYSLGRSVQKCDIVVDTAHWVSRQHLIITYVPTDNCFYIRDTSVNGTYRGDNTKISSEFFERVEPNTIIYVGTPDTIIKVAIE